MFYKTNRIVKTLSKSLLLATMAVFSVPAMSALSTSYYAGTSKIASGKWVKIKTTGAGVFEVSYDQLRAWGFANPAKVNVYGYGATLLTGEQFSTSLPDDVTLTYTLHEGDKIYFYSAGDCQTAITGIKNVTTNRNYYSTDVYFLLSDRDVSPTERVPEAPYIPDMPAFDAHLSLMYNEDEIQHPSVGGAIFFGQDIPADEPLEIFFQTEYMTPGNSPWTDAALRVNFGAYHSRMSTQLNVYPISSINEESLYYEYSRTSAVDDLYGRYAPGGSTALIFDAEVDDSQLVFLAEHPGGGQSFVAIDSYYLIYPRLNILDEKYSSMEMNFLSVSTNRNFDVYAPPTTHIINVSNPANIYAHRTEYTPGEGYLTASFDRTYSALSIPACRIVAFDTRRTQNQVTYAGQVTNQDIHGTPTPDMVIITTATLKEAAEELAQIHRQNDGMDVLVLTQDKIFNEFSSATPDAMAYRRMIKMFYDRDPQKMKFVVLYGPSSWDNRGIIVDPADRLLCYETTNVNYSAVDTHGFVSDCFFGMVDDFTTAKNIISAEQLVAVGRIPASNDFEARVANRKIARYLENPPKAANYSSVLLVSDDGDNNNYLTQSESLINRMISKHPAMSAVRAHNAIYEWEKEDAKILRSIISSAYKRGVGFSCFIGHNSDEYFGREHLWDFKSINRTDYDNPSMVMLSTCDAYGFDLPKNNMTQTMLFKDNGGANGIVAAARTVYATSNQDLAMALADRYASATPGTTMGQVWMYARNSIVNSPVSSFPLQANTMCYNFCGDPSLPVLSSHYDVEITSVNSTSVSDTEGTIALEPLKNIVVEGRVVDAGGKTVKDFNGDVTLVLRDAPYSVRTLSRGQHTADPVISVTIDNDILLSKTVTVTNGTFKAQLIAPVPVNEGGINRLTLHADSNDGQRADGSLKCLSIAAPAFTENPAEGEMPAIEFLSVNNPANPDGTVVSADDVRIVAAGSVSDLGLNSTTAIGAGCSLVIDGTRHIEGVKDLITADGNNRWTLTAPVENLDEGAHVATLIVADNAGQKVSSSFTFIVSRTAGDIVLNASSSNVHGSVELDVDNAPDAASDLSLVVEDLFGNPVATLKNVSFPYVLDFSELASGKLADGYYDVHLQVYGGGVKASSRPLRLAYIKH